jgi:hypothetical protein
MMKKIIQFFIFSFVLVSLSSFAQSLDANKLKEQGYELVFTNQSILSCGVNPNLEIYSSFDINILLNLSNVLSNNKIPISTNWDHFIPLHFNYLNMSETDFDLLPKDVSRILYICLTWNESQRLNLFQIPKAALENIASRLRKERPWQTLDKASVEKADALSDESLMQFINIVLRANVFEASRGNYHQNKSLFLIPWDWIVRE